MVLLDLKDDQFAPLAGAAGPFLSVSIDVTRDDALAAHELDLRWRALADRIRDVTPGEVATDVARAAVAPSGFAGAAGRLLVASPAGIQLELTYPVRPVRDEVVWGPVPHLLPLLRALARRPTHLLVEVDRSGADLQLIGPWGGVERRTVEGDDDELHKARVGGSARRGPRASAEPHVQARVEDSWERNAAAVTRSVERIVARERPGVVLLAGDDRAVALVGAALAGSTRDLVHRLDTGGRAAGTSSTALAAAVETELATWASGRRALVIDRFAGAESRQTEAVQGLADVVTSLQRGQVDSVLLHDDPSSTVSLWVGRAPFEIATTSEQLEDMGVESPVRVRADAAFVWAAVSAGADITLLDRDELALTEGIGAVLRWSDPATPHDRVPGMPGHGQPPGRGGS